MEIVIQYFDDCPSWQTARDNVVAAIASIGIDAPVVLTRVETDEQAVRLRFHGSPSIVVGGQDLFPTGDAEVGMSCRVYTVNGRQEGSPSVEQLTEALRSHTR